MNEGEGVLQYSYEGVLKYSCEGMLQYVAELMLIDCVSVGDH